MIKRGLQETMDGDPNGGAMTMLKHEQQDTLQKAVYDSAWFDRLVDVNQLTGYRLAPMKYAVSADCTSSDPNRVVDFAGYSGSLYDFDSRWPFAKDCASKFVQLSGDPAASASVQQELTKISDASPP